MLEYVGLSKLLLAPHLLVFGLAFAWYVRWTPAFGVWRVLLDVLGALGGLLALALSVLLFFEDPVPSAQGNTATWYVILSVVTLGVIPAVVLSCFALAGRVSGRLVAAYIER